MSSDEVYVFPMADGPVPVPQDLAREFSRPMRAYESRRDGIGWADIAEKENYPDAEAARRDVMLWSERAGALVAQQDRQLMLSLEVARIDRVVELIMPSLMNGRADAAMVVLRAVKLKTDLLHLDQAAPTAGDDGAGDVTPSVVAGETYTADLERILADDA